MESLATCSGIIGSASVKQIEIYMEWKIPDFFSLNVSQNEYLDSPTFSASECSWHLRLYPHGYSASGYLSLYLHNDSDTDGKTMSFTFGIKKSNGDLDEKETACRTFTKSQPAFGRKESWYRNYLLQNRTQLVPSDILTLTCRMKDSEPLPVDVAPQPMKFKELETLSTNLGNLYTSKTRHDVTIRVGSRQFTAHKAILMVRSRVFAAMFEHDMSEEETGVVTIEDCDPHSFEDFLQYMYSGRVDDVSFRTAHQLYITSDKYDVKELKLFCVEYMMRHLTAENLCVAVSLAERYGDSSLMKTAQDFFNRNVSRVLATSEWEAFLQENWQLANSLFKEMASNVKTQD